jgi:hypothetical protein
MKLLLLSIILPECLAGYFCAIPTLPAFFAFCQKTVYLYLWQCQVGCPSELPTEWRFMGVNGEGVSAGVLCGRTVRAIATAPFRATWYLVLRNVLRAHNVNCNK